MGTDAWIALFLAREDGSPLFLQIKEAQPSVLERFTRKTQRFPITANGSCVGQRLVQAASDIFLGWERFSWAGEERDYYFRQLRDWKGSVEVNGMTPAGMDLWGRMCGWTLARAHARSGDRIAIGAYLGKSEAFDDGRHRVLSFLRRHQRVGLPGAAGRHRLWRDHPIGI